jgi:hypothetical protein
MLWLLDLVYVKYSVAIENKVFNRRGVVRRQRKIVE